MLPRRQLLIVANGLREQSGHYFETTVALAEAARRFDCHPVVGAHVDCPPGLLPDGLECHRIFRTDHWMRPPTDRRSDLTTDTGREGNVSVAARPPIARPTARQTAASAARLAKVAARYAMPPLAYDLARVLVYGTLPRIVRGRERSLARQDLRLAARRWRYGAVARHAEQAAGWPAILAALHDFALRPRVIDALDCLAPLGSLAELNHALVFRQDLDNFLQAAGACSKDHVILPTAHARELLAIHLIADQLTLDASPSFHLEFRHPLFEGHATAENIEQSPNAVMQRAFFALHAGWGTSPRIRFYTDADALADDYESFSGLPFDVLPLPFRAELIPPAAHRTSGSLTVAYLGGARDEKGFHWLPELVRELRLRNGPGRVRFLIQSNIDQPEHNPQSVAALSKFEPLAGDDLELVALADGLPAVNYYRLFSQCDVIVLPYLPARYRASTSGVMAEALAAGVPVVVPAETWLSSQLPPGAGVVFAGFDSFVDAVQRVIEHHSQYRAAASAARKIWRTQHTPDALVAALLTSNSRPPGPSHQTAQAAATCR